MEKKIERAIIKLKKQRFLNKNRIIDELFKEINDNGILETSCVLSLKCPVSRTRIKTPIRFHQCKHAQCFDADSFFQLTYNSVIKKCPICNLQGNYNSLIVDGLFYEILKHTSNDIENVILYSDGNWKIKKENSTTNKNNCSSSNYYNRKNHSYKHDSNNSINNNNKNCYCINNSDEKCSNIEINYKEASSSSSSSSSKRSNNKNIIYSYKIIGK
ncbi:hypothetical protein BCR36DRAFT_394702 [Piromyces finnis]|uniref:SP-RING-type domain-containing protein n=1 Tax=Piromyces finnis TaxID=1754191 RepID=A0A1Y1VM35_9FUNG|nr:hypothetical protein BCR36DRAFT_394702 [Piromyces finnis]|eukprot:ORX59186.1 hypothetical protein BCR36DRAFT_394702 [Piromyces finnis]